MIPTQGAPVRVERHCPICGKTLDENNRLFAEYHGDYNWFVLKHEKRDNELSKWRGWCAQAKYQLTFNP